MLNLPIGKLIVYIIVAIVSRIVTILTDLRIDQLVGL